jgi:hypothetical protein
VASALVGGVISLPHVGQIRWLAGTLKAAVGSGDRAGDGFFVCVT